MAGLLWLCGAVAVAVAGGGPSDTVVAAAEAAVNPADTGCDAVPRMFHSVQLAGCNTDCGRVEVKAAEGDAWGFVCSPKWTLSEAAVICRSLGFDSAFGAMPTFGGASGKPVVTSVNCTGDEASLEDCALTLARDDAEGAAACLPASAVGISCINAGGLPQDAESVSLRARFDAQATQHVADWVERAADRAQLVADEWFGSEGAPAAGGGGEAADAASSCDILPGVPMPFAREIVTEAYVLAAQVYDEFAAMDAALRARLCDPAHGAEVQRALAGLVERGLRWNALGLDLANLTDATPAELALLHELYLGHNKHTALHWDLDQPLRAAPGIPADGFTAAEAEMYGTLQRDGILPVSDYGLGDDVLDALAATAADAVTSTDTNVTSSVSGGDVVTARLPLPSLEPVLTNSSIQKVLRAFLGSEVTLHGYKLTKLSTTSRDDVASYVAARWHHDRAGRRVKMFVYLHDIDCDEGHPTQVAAGTHRLAYYRTEEFPMSRYTDDYVAKEYDIIKGCGKRGGGFIFDTHTVHKGTPWGSKTRTTVITEFHNSNKCPAVKALGLPIPCPSGDQFMLYRGLPTTSS